MSTDGSTSAAGLAYPYSIKRHGVTITNCNDEPVQTPGCIQPHGVLLALRPQDLTILQVSENCGTWLGLGATELLGQTIGVLLDSIHVDLLQQFLKNQPVERNPLHAFSARLIGDRQIACDVTVHTVDGVALVELEHAEERTRPGRDYHTLLKRATARLQAAESLAVFCRIVAEEVRFATGLDRVMVYRFLPDEAGEVFAETKREDLHSWLGLRYPADDIPKPAREIFRRIGVRPLPNAAAEPAEMVPLMNPHTHRPLDMTYCALRGASVMYTEYLQNMGVAASLTMPIIRDGLLWGLIACHHYSPTSFPYMTRAAAELLAQVASLQIKNAEEREHTEYRNRIDAAHYALLSRAAHEGSLGAMTSGSPTLLDGIHSGGVALFYRERWWTAGRTPSSAQLNALVSWLRTLPEMNAVVRPAFACDGLSACFPAASAYADIGSGLLAVPLARGHRNLILWFRPEQVQTFNWAGNPHEKPQAVGPHGMRLTPRKSFELWQEQVRGRSRSWNAVEIDAALKLRLLTMDLVASRAEQLATMNADLARSNEELDAFAYVASHDLKEPLRGIHKYAYYLMEEAQAGRALGEAAKERLEGLLRLTVRMDGLLDALLHFSRVGRLNLEYEDVPLDQVLQEAVEMLGARVEESGAKIRVPRTLPEITCDRVRVREIFSNLISNAIKYSDKTDRWVEIGYVEPDEAPPAFYHRDAAPPGAAKHRIFYVRDEGIGIDPRHHEQVFKMFKRLHPREAFGGGSGAGLTITRKLVEQHLGQIWLESAPGQGTIFFFTLPCSDESSSTETAR